MCPDGEYEPERVFTDEQLRYPDPASDMAKKEKEKKTFAPFPPALVEALLENGEWHFHGVCGRDTRGLPTLPKGYRVKPNDGSFTADGKLRFGFDRLCDTREMTGQEVQKYREEGLLPPDVSCGWMFMNPDDEELEDAKRW